MATESQDFFKHYDDSFSLVFSVTDVTENLNGYYAYWSCATSPSSSTLVYKNTSTSGNNPGKFTGAGSGNEVILITDQTITIPFTQADFADAGDTDALYTGSFYHELIIGQLANGDDSNVIASGEITIKEDLGGVVR